MIQENLHRTKYNTSHDVQQLRKNISSDMATDDKYGEGGKIVG